MDRRILVCGGREYDDRDFVYRILDAVHRKQPISEIIHGACHKGGADILAEDWAKSRQVNYRGIPAKWGKLGKRAGRIRNKEMLDAASPSGVVAFPGGDGTADMVKQARDRGISVWSPLTATVPTIRYSAGSASPD